MYEPKEEPRYETLHDFSLSMAKFLMWLLLIVLAVFAVKTIVKTRSFDIVSAFLDSTAIIGAAMIAIAALVYFCEWALYSLLKKRVLKKGTAVGGTIVDMKKISRITYGGGHNDYRYIVRTDDGDTVKSCVYKTPIIMLPKKCTVHRLGRTVVLTDIGKK